MVSKIKIEEEILYHLKNGDFETAKNVFDQWLMKKNAHPDEVELSNKDIEELAALF